jgi:hypothetical protein
MAQVGFVGCLLMSPRTEMRGGLSVVLGRMLEVLGRFSMMVHCYGRHVRPPQ